MISSAPPLPLTARQQKVLDWIRRYLESTGMPPTRAEIATGLGVSTASSAEDHLRALARKGALLLTPGASRGLRLKEAPELPGTGMPLVGRVAAGGFSRPSTSRRTCGSIRRCSRHAPTICCAFAALA
jgi:repressor LexA